MKKGIFLAGIIAALFFMGSHGFTQDKLNVYDKTLIMQSIAERVREAYLDTLSVDTLYDGAIQGMIDKLDPHSSYMPPKEADDFSEKIVGNFQGIGITFFMLNKKITVIELIKDGPSQKAGLKSRDRIIKIDGENAVGITDDEVKSKLRGPAGSTVEVLIERPGVEKPIAVKIKRDNVELDSVSHSYMLDGETGYIALSRFSLFSNIDVSKALVKLKSEGMKKLILDLRNNSGGSLDAAIKLVDIFIKDGVIVSTKGRREMDNREWDATGKGNYLDMPMVVLINHGSASASEIVAGALQDHDRAIIAGQTSFGKGLVMNPFVLRKGGNENLGTLVLTVARYYTPSGRLIQRPYTGSREEYIKEGFDDIDPNALDADKTGEEIFKTDLKRNVYGGGGITPDRLLKPGRRLNELERSVKLTNLVFEFGDSYLQRIKDIPSDFSEFLKNYRISDAEMKTFRDFLNEKKIDVNKKSSLKDEIGKDLKNSGVSPEKIDNSFKAIEASGIKLEEPLFEISRDYFEREIKQEIARMIWGSEESYKVWHTDDSELDQAVALLPESEELLNKRLALKESK
jgi:carboxyl-terminal processing protease